MTIKVVNGERTLERTAEVLKALDELIDFALSLPISDEDRHALYRVVGTAITEAEIGVIQGFLATIENMSELQVKGEVTQCQGETETI